MASEIRVNKITHTAGVGTVTSNTHGIVVAGIVTANSFSGVVQTLLIFLLQKCMVLLESEVIYK